MTPLKRALVTVVAFVAAAGACEFMFKRISEMPLHCEKCTGPIFEPLRGENICVGCDYLRRVNRWPQD